MLKAFLRQAGVELEALRKKPLGHDLEALLAKAKADGFSGYDVAELGRLVTELLTSIQARVDPRFLRMDRS